jgi:hypothetical protein
MDGWVHRVSIASTLIVLASSGGVEAATAQPVPGVRGGGVAVTRSLASPRGMTAMPELRATTMGNSCSLPPASGPTHSRAAKTAASGLGFVGAASATAGGSGVRFLVDHIVNNRSSGTSGPLRLALWATTTVPILGAPVDPYTLGTYDFGPLTHGFEYTNVDTGFVPFAPPLAGCYYLTIALLEFQSVGYFYQDLVTFTAGGTPDGSGHDLFSFGGADCSGGLPACTRDSQTACLLGGRFLVRTTYQTNSSSGSGNVMSFTGSRAENDQSAFFWFFNDTNFEMGLKMVDACSFNNQFWVYIGGLTDQGWAVKITDTQTGAVRIYSNDLGHLSTPVGDTSAFSCP